MVCGYRFVGALFARVPVLVQVFALRVPALAEKAEESENDQTNSLHSPSPRQLPQLPQLPAQIQTQKRRIHQFRHQT